MSEANGNSLDSLVGLSGFRCIVADPPWPYPEGFGIGRVPKGQVNDGRRNALPYECMTLDEIKALPVAGCAADGCHLYLWTTNRYLRQAFDVMETWGFKYGQTIVWAKKPIGSVLGGAFPACLEFVLFGRRGRLRHIRRAESAWWNWPRTCKHSKKPDQFFDMVATVSPEPRLEPFARRKREGWTCWGNEVKANAESEALT